MQTLIQTLSEFGLKLQYSDLDPATVRTAKQALLDACGNILNGRFHSETGPVLKYVYSHERQDLGKGYHLPADPEHVLTLRGVLFALCAMGRIADMDDGFSRAMGHPGSFLVPVLLTLGEENYVSGEEAIAALTAAYDIYARIGEVINPFMHRDRGFDATGVCGAVAAAFLISRLNGWSGEITENAMGLAAGFSGGLIECQNDGTSGKYLCGAWAVMNGLQAAELAENGLTGAKKALEGKSGLFHGFRGSRMDDESRVPEGLGENFKINEVYFKRYACLRGIHATMDAVRRLKEEHHLTAERILGIDVRASGFLMRLSRPDPQTLVAAQGSLQFGAAAVMIHDGVNSAGELMRYLEEPEVRDLMSKVTVTEDADMQRKQSSGDITGWNSTGTYAASSGGRGTGQQIRMGDSDRKVPYSAGGNTLCRQKEGPGREDQDTGTVTRPSYTVLI